MSFFYMWIELFFLCSSPVVTMAVPILSHDLTNDLDELGVAPFDFTVDDGDLDKNLFT